MRISLVAGVLLKHDAISSSIKIKARALREICDLLQTPLALRIYVLQADANMSDLVKVVSSTNDIILDDHFLSSDLIFYDFGIYSSLFDSIRLAPASAAKIVHYHNITPPELVPECDRNVIKKSFEQLSNIFEADLVLTEGRFNRKCLIDIGVAEEKIDCLNLVVNLQKTSSLGSEAGGVGIVEALYVGRFVPSKGLFDLLKALKQVLGQGTKNIHLNLVGNVRLSNEKYMREIKNYINKHGLKKNADFVGEVGQDELHCYYEHAHLFVIPSYHEGFCLPVIEALSHGCYVITYDAGNLPYIVNGFGNVVETGDTNSLSNKIADYVNTKANGKAAKEIMLNADMGLVNEASFKSRAMEYCQEFTYGKFRERFFEILRERNLIS